MATFSLKGCIDLACVESEIARLKRLWSGNQVEIDPLAGLLPDTALATLDPFDRVQLAHGVATCRSSRSLSEAGRLLFAASRAQKTSSNDADRLRNSLARFDLNWQQLAS